MTKFTNEDLWFELNEDNDEYFSAHVTMIINEHSEDWCREHKCDLGYITYIVRDEMFELLGDGSNFHPDYADQESAIISAIDPHISGMNPDILSQGRGTSVALDHSQWVKMYT